jgi:uncharacterized protein
MAHQCVHCKRIIPAASEELLSGCKNCGNHFFFYIRDDKLTQLKEVEIEMNNQDKKQIEKDIREMVGIPEEDIPVILDIESVRVTSPGKFEIDLPNLFNKNRPLVYKIEEGKYIIDLTSTLGKSVKELKEIRDPDEK